MGDRGTVEASNETDCCFLLAGVVVAAMSLVAGGAAAADQLDEIKQKGMLVVGVKTDYPPWGMRDTSGKIVGMEPDMAADVAKRLGVKLELVSVVVARTACSSCSKARST